MKDIFAERWKVRLGQCGPQTVAATALKKSASTISLWGGDTGTVPGVEDHLALAAAYGVSPAWLAWGEGPQDKNAYETGLSLGAALELLPLDQRERFLEGVMNLAGLDYKSSPAAQFFKFTGMPNTMIQPFSTRDALLKQPYRLSFSQRPNFKPVKLFRNLAAGYGGGANYEVMEEAYVFGVPRGGFTVAEVRGDSMVATLQDGDFVLLKDFPAPGYELPRIESRKEKIDLDRWKAETHIQDMDIVVVDLDQPEGKTLKRVKYDVRRGKDNWKMLIAADNPLSWQDAWQVGVGDKVTFYGTLMGLCEKV